MDATASAEEERLGIGRDLLAYLYRSYFATEVFHADPHPGRSSAPPRTGSLELAYRRAG
ncbi:putative unusual protein kinase regulating ubiquinone biosynthesis (AarF/ABC1/UbiB family) [Amycolatopsis bartoniae]|uniref:Uncharacterized protein n=1 Tax=Amycolatopsis bartoniae TaxID=941986 RepID=A0A8H9J1C2_9PSEU|nr:hypothetical protein [Amycolatopsis bartoniae]MBB2938415.1 putative unusual protein kinase regulating ubiquinone biosynthesis (AarF/ABC1/UbiB family) [Amycolatopsis bartoniae]GHF71184.1 hypothetical protein GCM10017566_51300 [Amycolatopsis bartoniae]